MERYGLHFARPGDVEQLLEYGFSAEARTVQAWAAGVYLATDRESAELYDDGERQALLVRAEVDRSFVVDLPDDPATIFEEVKRALQGSFGAGEAALVSPSRLRAERLSLAGQLTRILCGKGFDSLEVRMPWPASRNDMRSIHFGGNQLVVFDPARVQALGMDAGLPLPSSGRPAVSELEAPRTPGSSGGEATPIAASPGWS